MGLKVAAHPRGPARQRRKKLQIGFVEKLMDCGRIPVLLKVYSIKVMDS